MSVLSAASHGALCTACNPGTKHGYTVTHKYDPKGTANRKQIWTYNVLLHIRISRAREREGGLKYESRVEYFNKLIFQL